MLVTEWNWDDALAVQREEALEEGLAKGMAKGMAKGRQEAATEYAEQIRHLEEEIRRLRGV
jgi:flagellar biosynthesis/type III secretory pathway protein FliH